MHDRFPHVHLGRGVALGEIGDEAPYLLDRHGADHRKHVIGDTGNLAISFAIELIPGEMEPGGSEGLKALREGEPLCFHVMLRVRTSAMLWSVLHHANQ